MTLDEKIKIVQSKGFELIGKIYPDGTLLVNHDHCIQAHILPPYNSKNVKIVKYVRINSKLFKKEITASIDLFKSDDSFFFGYVQGTFNHLNPILV
jgi:hypothetical protein